MREATDKLYSEAYLTLLLRTVSSDGISPRLAVELALVLRHADQQTVPATLVVRVYPGYPRFGRPATCHQSSATLPGQCARHRRVLGYCCAVPGGVCWDDASFCRVHSC